MTARICRSGTSRLRPQYRLVFHGFGGASGSHNRSRAGILGRVPVLRPMTAFAICFSLAACSSSTSVHDLGTVHTRFGDARAMCGGTSGALCGDASAAAFPECSGTLVAYLGLPNTKDASVIVRAEQQRLRNLLGTPPSGNRWVEWSCGSCVPGRMGEASTAYCQHDSGP